MDAEGKNPSSIPVRLLVDILCSTYDGNVLDAAVLAASTALLHTRYPRSLQAQPTATAAPHTHGGSGAEAGANAPQRQISSSSPAGPRLLRVPVSLTCARTGAVGGAVGALVADPSASNGEDAPGPGARVRGLAAGASAARGIATALVTVVVACDPPAGSAGVKSVGSGSGSGSGSASGSGVEVVSTRVVGSDGAAVTEEELTKAMDLATARARALLPMVAAAR